MHFDHKSHLAIIEKANQYFTAGNFLEAEKLYHFVIGQNKFYADAWLGLANIAERMNRKINAIDYILRAVVSEPGLKKYRIKLKKLTKNYNRLDKSLMHQRCSLLFAGNGDIKNALFEIQKAILLAPKIKDNLLYFSRFLVDVRFTSKVENNVTDNIINAYKYEFSDHQNMSLASLSALRWDDGLLLLFGALTNNVKDEEWEELLRLGTVKNALNNQLLYWCIKSSLITDVSFELLLTKVRKILLKFAVNNSADKLISDYSLFLSGLAIQCYYNEYVFYISEIENSWLEKLSCHISKELKQLEVVNGDLLMLYGSYKSVQEVIDGAILENNDENLASVVKYQVDEPRLEAVLRSDIPTITDISYGASKLVKGQYEVNPFPRWLSFPATLRKESFSEFISEISKNKCEVADTDKKINILVAGCGTGLIPCIYAKRFPDAKILAIDLSKASLAHGYRKSKEMGLVNIEFAQADILNLANLGDLKERFDFINCFGVLHHMEHIEPGWKVLRSLLRQDGIMQIGLYSKLARKSVFEIRDYVLQKGYPSTSEGMRQCRYDLIKLNNRQFDRIIKSKAFYSMSNFRDLAFHVHEICIDIPQLKTMLEEIKLEFLRFEFGYPETERQYGSLYPEDTDMISLDNWNEFEKMYPDTFENTYKFWVKKI